MENEQFDMIAKTLHGLEDVLADELTRLKADEVKAGRRMVSFRGDRALMYRANFYCRTALRILKPVYSFKAGDADTVYDEVKKIAWEQYLSPDRTFAVDAVVYSETFKHSKFVAYRVKDAIADYFAEKYGRRPSVRINRPDMYIHVHVSHHDCTVSLDSSGESLHRRGYRSAQGEAPLNEVLAAGMILKTGWHGESHFVDPMCGTGTLLIEAAMIALNVPPGLYRKEYAFERWDDFDGELFAAISEDESEERAFDFKCFGSDTSAQALKTAERSIRNAGLSKYIELKKMPFQQYAEPPRPGILITNPPYGERIPADDLAGLYAMIGERLKHVFTGYRAWILSSSEECLDNTGLRPSCKIRLMNGQLECEYRCYELFEGKNRDYKKALAEQTLPVEHEEHPYAAKRDAPFDRRERPYQRQDAQFDRRERRPYQRQDAQFDRRERPYQRQDAQSDRRERPYQRQDAQSDRRERPYQRQDAQSDRRERPYQRQDAQFDRRERPYQRRDAQSDRRERPYQRQDAQFDRRERPYQRQDAQSDRRERPYQRQDAQSDRRERPYQKRDVPFDSRRLSAMKYASDRKPLQKRSGDSKIQRFRDS